MRFESLDPSAIRSIRQLDLLNAWLRLPPATGSSAPPAAAYAPDRIADERADLVYYHVEANSGAPRILIASDGSRIAAAYGTAGESRHGQDLADYLGAAAAAHVIPIYHECIRRARPVYTVAEIDDVHGRPVTYERLLLPFSDGADVNRIIASVKAISEEGRFEIRNLLHGPDRTPVFRLMGVIDRAKRSPSAPRDGDIVAD